MLAEVIKGKSVTFGGIVMTMASVSGTGASGIGDLVGTGMPPSGKDVPLRGLWVGGRATVGGGVGTTSSGSCV